MMKKHMQPFAFLTAVLLCASLAFTACAGKTGGLSWTVEEVGGDGGLSVSTGLRITFSKAVNKLEPSELIIGRAAVIDVTPNILTGEEDVPLFVQEGKAWLIPIRAKFTGEATVRIEKKGIAAAGQRVEVYGSFTLPEPGAYLNSRGKPEGYLGTPFVDPDYPRTADLPASHPEYMPAPYPDKPNGQLIPGRVLCAFYDNGPVNVAFYDNGKNSGSGGLNTSDSYKDSFRMGDPITDISYLKGFFTDGQMDRMSNDIVDFHGYSSVFIPDELINMFYVGWTNSGEWFRISVDVQKTGLYEVQLFYSNINEGAPARITLDFDPEKVNASELDADTSVECFLSSTQKKEDPTSWRRGYHHWNKSIVAYIYLEAGQSVMTVRLQNGEMNYCYFDFNLIED